MTILRLASNLLATLVWLAIIVTFLMAVAWGAGVLAAVAAAGFDWVRAL